MIVEGIDGGAEYRNPIRDRLGQMLSDARAAGDRVAVLVVHSAAIDRVDAIHGFHAGDLLSKQIEELLRFQVVRRQDVVEPIARDEFICVLRPVLSEGVAMLAVQRMLTLLAAPIEFAGKSVAADVTTGIALYPDHADSAEELLQCGKHALNLARSHGERAVVYERKSAAPSVDPLQYESRLRKALEQNSLSLHFQPQLDSRTGRLAGAEALLRWKDEVLGQVPPNIAVQAAESAGLIDQVSLWVVTSAVQHCAEFQKIVPDFSVSINISPSNLRESDLPFYIDRALRTWGVNGRGLVVEITETAMMVDPKKARDALLELKSYGVRLSVDDFGTGYSSIYYLAQLPLDELKIDLMFVKSMLELPHYAKIVRSLIDLAHNLELMVVAEGVENEPIQDALQHLGCDYLQGYHIGRPVPAEDLKARLRAQHDAQ
jgi:diguanylate cyclase (GGDEF)-like protein